MRHSVHVVSFGIVLIVLGAPGLPFDDVSAQPANAAVDALAAEPTGTTQRAAFYAEVARADVRTLKTLIERAAELNDPATKSFALDVLLTRYAELDPGGAVAAANTLGPSAPNPVPFYQAWLRSSPAAALAAIAKLSESQASAIVPALLARVQTDQELVAEILAAAPRPVADRYVSNSILRLAQDSPREALERAQEIADPGVRTDTVNGVLRTWASRDPRTFLDYLPKLDETTRRNTINGGFWYQIASREPELALDHADLFPPELRGPIAISAIGRSLSATRWLHTREPSRCRRVKSAASSCTKLHRVLRSATRTARSRGLVRFSRPSQRHS